MPQSFCAPFETKSNLLPRRQFPAISHEGYLPRRQKRKCIKHLKQTATPCMCLWLPLPRCVVWGQEPRGRHLGRKHSLAGESFDLQAKLGSLHFAECLMPFTLFISSWSRRFLGAGCVSGAVLGTVGIKDGLKLESVLFVETLLIHTTASNRRDPSVAKGIPWEFRSSLQVLGGCLHCSAARSISFILPRGCQACRDLFFSERG